MMPNQLVWVDIPVVDLDRAIAFYSAVLAAPVPKQEAPGLLIAIIPDVGERAVGCLYQSDSDQPSDHGPLLYFSCEGRLDNAIAAAEEMGGKVIQPKHQMSKYGFRAIVLDTEGNRIALHSS